MKRHLAVITVLLVGAGLAVAFFGGGGATASVEPSLAFESVGDEVGFQYNTTGPNTGNGDGAVLVTDFDNDGWDDLLAVGGDRPILYENTGGELVPSGALPAVDVTELKSALFFDYDNDGWEDLLLVPRADELVFLENDGGTFRHADVGLDTRLAWGTSASTADYDGDGCLDLFVTQNGNWTREVPNRARDRPLDDDNGSPNLLFKGNCESFERVTDAGIEGTRWSLVSSFTDLTGDGTPDVHVANDFNYDVLYINRGDGTFQKHRIPDSNRHGMASDVEDVDGDGRRDIFVTNIEYENPDNVWVMQSGLGLTNRGNMLLMNQGNGTFRDVAGEKGIRQGGWGWSGNLVDFDNDGDFDLVHTTQSYVELEGGDKTSQQDNYQPVITYPAVWRHDNGSFERANASELGFERSNGRGLAVLDIDRDGRRDVVVADTTNEFKLYRNVGGSGHWLRIRAQPGPGQTAIGAEISVTVDGETRTTVQSAGTNYFSQNPRYVQFGLDDVTTVDRVVVVYPDGTERTLTDLAADQFVSVHYNGTVERKTSSG